MVNTGETYNNLQVYKVVMSYPQYGGYDKFQFLAKSRGQQQDYKEVFQNWRTVAEIDGRIFYSMGNQKFTIPSILTTTPTSLEKTFFSTTKEQKIFPVV